MYCFGNYLFTAGDNSSGSIAFQKGPTDIGSAKCEDAQAQVDTANLSNITPGFADLIKAGVVNPDILNYMGYTTRKVGNFDQAEKFYLEGLKIKPNHNGINEYLGELYVQTNQIDKANERLAVLKNCNCDEYNELQLIIKNKGVKVY